MIALVQVYLEEKIITFVYLVLNGSTDYFRNLWELRGHVPQEGGWDTGVGRSSSIYPNSRTQAIFSSLSKNEPNKLAYYIKVGEKQAVVYRCYVRYFYHFFSPVASGGIGTLDIRIVNGVFYHCATNLCLALRQSS